MTNNNVPIASNPLLNKNDLGLAVKQLCDPLKPYYSAQGALLDIGNTASRTSQKTAKFEGFARPLWGLAPLLAGGGTWDYWENYIKGIRSGTDPMNEEYWENIGDCDQKMVELASIALTLILAPEQSWGQLNEQEKANLASWIGQTNQRITVDTNWRFFRVLVNVALLKVGCEYDKEMIEQDLNRLDEFYLSTGWYKDGDTEQMDYYIPFAFHFYSLIYAQVMENEDPERSRVYKERAALFAKDFIYWFGKHGAALAFGRSLTYRFAQSCFWGALAFAGVEAFPWGVIKGLLLRNLRWWFEQPMFSPEGILTIGYSYPNLMMAEGYNAPGSPYWAMKSFLPLALADDHPFWLAEELPLPELEAKSVQKEARMIVCREAANNHVVAFTSGQHAGFEPAHCAEKYGKFAYSNLLGFSVSKGSFGLEQGAYDNNLALAEKDNLYRTRRKCEEFRIEDNLIYSLWRPWRDVEVRSWIVPGLPWHIRIHRIQTERELDIAEGGFSIPTEQNMKSFKNMDIHASKGSIAALLTWGGTGIKSLLGDLKAEMLHPEPNVNLMHPKTMIPTLRKELQIGTHWIASAIFVQDDIENIRDNYDRTPVLQVKDNRIIVKEQDNILVDLEMI
ncbi:DUF2264 domain-containing protein [Paenibacillus wynnii]|uniref:DUF2264 domain-containing protein n=1 Tax=Paenibacillus wynnii TaxID=268407 RepID=A0A098MB64_9BACL|nr:DUF2264 domain-containing protein [Paenibacillus wynnii]KGE18777.1 hypothetical protein PWYN_04890 [Paenibacillus wynnii]